MICICNIKPPTGLYCGGKMIYGSKEERLMIKNMTEGKPSSILWRFSLPMLLSVVFQQLYNIVDSIVAGKFAGVSALAAVGASYPITVIFIAIATGSNIGCNVIISQLFGAKELDKMKTAVYTSLISVSVLGMILTILGTIFCNPLIKVLNTPENIFFDSALYLRIYVFGVLFLFIYNICTGIFTALGDSKTPLYFLIASSLGNIALDLLFVAGLNMGVAGVAWATFICQGVASVLAMLTLLKRLGKIGSKRKIDLFSPAMLGKLALIAVPSILQQSFVSVGNLFIQVLVNGFGSAVIAAFSVAIKLNTFAVTSLMTMANGISSYTAQNIGAGKIERVRQGYRCGIRMMIIVCIPFIIAYFFFTDTMMRLFLDSSEDVMTVLSAGRKFLKIVSPFYFVVGLKMITDAVLRGAGAMKAFMATTFLDLILRVVLAFILSSFFMSTGIWMSWPFGWSISALLSVVFYMAGVWKLPPKCQEQL